MTKENTFKAQSRSTIRIGEAFALFLFGPRRAFIFQLKKHIMNTNPCAITAYIYGEITNSHSNTSLTVSFVLILIITIFSVQTAEAFDAWKMELFCL
jgi:hypothetical protein